MMVVSSASSRTNKKLCIENKINQNSRYHIYNDEKFTI